MELSFKVHLDDYHSTITAHWRTERACVAHVDTEIKGGYDVSNITLDGHPFDIEAARVRIACYDAPVVERCPRVLHTGEPCPNAKALRSPSRPQDGYLATCITHDHEDRYNADTYAYKGD